MEYKELSTDLFKANTGSFAKDSNVFGLFLWEKLFVCFEPLVIRLEQLMVSNLLLVLQLSFDNDIDSIDWISFRIKELVLYQIDWLEIVLQLLKPCT